MPSWPTASSRPALRRRPAGFAAGAGVPAGFAAGFLAAGFFTPAFLAVASGFDAALAAFVLVPLAAFFGSGAGMVGGDYTKNFLSVLHPIGRGALLC